MAESKRDFYNYFSQNLIRGFIYLILLIVVLVLAKKYFATQYEAIEHWVSDDYWLMFLIFLISEIFVGVIPPELFMIWTKDDPATLYEWVIVAMSIISLGAGWINFYVGGRIGEATFFRRFFGRKLKKYKRRYEQYGGGIIIVAALTPLPFALISLIAGSLAYPVKKYLKYSTFRILRFVVYGLIIWFYGGI
jgi:uncharacterized membrane protein YdjX (TVP38/TMEM64 family)